MSTSNWIFCHCLVLLPGTERSSVSRSLTHYLRHETTTVWRSHHLLNVTQYSLSLDIPEVTGVVRQLEYLRLKWRRTRAEDLKDHSCITTWRDNRLRYVWSRMVLWLSSADKGYKVALRSIRSQDTFHRSCGRFGRSTFAGKIVNYSEIHPRQLREIDSLQLVCGPDSGRV